MESYRGDATLVVGGQSFAIRCAFDEGYKPTGGGILGWRLTLGGQRSWSGYFRLLEPDRKPSFHAALSEHPTATLRLPDGREAKAAVEDDTIQSVDGRWPA